MSPHNFYADLNLIPSLRSLNESDDDLDNPLNQAMIKEHTCTGFKWSKETKAVNPDKILEELNKK